MALGIAAIQYSLISISPSLQGYSGWLFFAFLVGRVLGINHPEVIDGRKLDQKRTILGWLAIVLFILCFTPEPFVFE